MSYSEIINTILAFFTLLTLIFSIKSSRSASKAADAAIEQANIMRMDSEHQLSANIMPKEEIFRKPKLPIEIKMNLNEMIHLQKGDLKVVCINSGLGNAYYITSWIEIRNLNLYPYGKDIRSPAIYCSETTNHYSIERRRSGDDSKDILRLRLNDISRADGRNEYDFDLVKLSQEKMFLQSKDDFQVLFPSYAQILLIDRLYQWVDPNTDKEGLEEPLLDLVIKYKTEAQSKTSGETFRRFAINIVEPKLYQGELSFKLMYSYIGDSPTN